MEGKGFRDGIREFESRDCTILGASFDDRAANTAFAEKFDFPFDLLCDTERELGLACGACDEPDAKHARRISLLVGPDGRVVKAWPEVDPKAHPAEALAALKAARE